MPLDELCRTKEVKVSRVDIVPRFLRTPPEKIKVKVSRVDIVPRFIRTPPEKIKVKVSRVDIAPRFLRTPPEKITRMPAKPSPENLFHRRKNISCVRLPDNKSFQKIQLDFKYIQQAHAESGIRVQRKLPPRQPNMPSLQKTRNRKPSDERLPMSSEYVLRNFLPYLINYEQTEISNYKQVWYLGKISTKDIRCSTQNQQLFNFGFDTEEGLYRTIVNDHLAYRYEILAIIGNGFSGEVLKCFDHKTRQLLAIKVFRNKDSVLKLAKSEMKVLKALKESDKNNSANIVHMKEHFYFRHHLCITFDLYDGDLYRVMKRKDKHRVTEDELKKYTVDILKCLQLLRKKNIVHGDLKPENILVRKKNDERQSAVTDFGGSFLTIERDKPLVFTLSYMSPELLLGKKCRTAIDMWSLGCIVAELHLSQRLFKGPDTHSIFSSIMEVLGVPPEELLQGSPQRKQFFDSNGNPRRMETTQKLRTTVATKLKSNNVYFIDFIESCLEYDPKKRMTPDKALRHPWIRKLFEPKTSSRLSDKAPICTKIPITLRREKREPLRLQPVKRIVSTKPNFQNDRHFQQRGCYY